MPQLRWDESSRSEFSDGIREGYYRLGVRDAIDGVDHVHHVHAISADSV